MHRKFAEQLERFQGETSPFSAAAEDLTSCLNSQFREKQSLRPKPYVFVFAGILLALLAACFTLAAAGAVLGLVGALVVSHLMAGLLYGVSPYDLSTFAGVTAVLATVAIAASYVPALRPMRLDPITTLHAE